MISVMSKISVFKRVGADVPFSGCPHSNGRHAPKQTQFVYFFNTRSFFTSADCTKRFCAPFGREDKGYSERSAYGDRAPRELFQLKKSVWQRLGGRAGAAPVPFFKFQKRSRPPELLILLFPTFEFYNRLFSLLSAFFLCVGTHSFFQGVCLPTVAKLEQVGSGRGGQTASGTSPAIAIALAGDVC